MEYTPTGEVGLSVSNFGRFAEQVGIKEKTYDYINSIIAVNSVKGLNSDTY